MIINLSFLAPTPYKLKENVMQTPQPLGVLTELFKRVRWFVFSCFRYPLPSFVSEKKRETVIHKIAKYCEGAGPQASVAARAEYDSNTKSAKHFTGLLSSSPRSTKSKLYLDPLKVNCIM